MKSMKKLHVAVAIAALFSATGSMAASISQSGVTVAREVIANNTQVLRAPTVTFNYVGALSTNANSSQDFSITLELSSPDVGGTPQWNSVVPNHESIEIKFNNGAAAQVPVLASGTTPALKVAIESLGIVRESATTLRYRFRLVNNTAAAANLNNVQVSFNVTTADFIAATVSGIDLAAQPVPTGIVYGTVTNLATVVGTVDADGATATTAKPDLCSDGDRKIAVTARNYTGSGDGVLGESGAAGVTNNGYILFSQALNVVVGKGVAVNRSTNPTTENKVLTADAAGFGTTTTMALGFLKFQNITNVDAWDTDIAGSYYKFRTGAAAGDLATFGALRTDGAVDTSSVQVKLESDNGFAVGSTFTLANNPMCVGTGGTNLLSSAATSVLSNGDKTATLTFSHAQLVAAVNSGVTGSLSAAAGNNLTNGTGAPITGYTATTDRLYLCYVNTGNAVIPQSTFTATAKLLKEAGANEQANQSCPRPMAGLGGGVKIDVRNFFPYQNDNQEWISVLRVINNSESTNADLTGQYIRADGKYGKWGSLGTLPARGAVYFTSKEIDAALTSNTTTADAAITDNSGAGGITADAGKLAPNTRVRVSSNAASTLRVQNYMFNTRTLQLVEVSASQGADFVNIEASDRDHIDQDAQTGIKK